MSSVVHNHKKVAEERAVTKESVTPEPLGHLLVERLLHEAGFKGEISSKPELLNKYSTDESIFSIRPQIVIQPMDGRDVEIAVSVLSYETKRFPTLSLTPRAAGTGLGGGSLTDSVVIDMKEHMNRVLRVGREDAKVTFTSEPGAWWRDQT